MTEAKLLLAKDLMECIKKFSYRCLNRATKWASDLLYAVSRDNFNSETSIEVFKDISMNEFAIISSAIAFFNLGEYKRASHLLQHPTSPLTSFLHFYCDYMELLKLEWEENSKDFESSFISHPSIENDFVLLLEGLKSSKFQDSFNKYLQAIIYIKLKNQVSAIDSLFESIWSDYINWPAWLELVNFTTLDTLDEYLNKLPKIWMKDFFLLEVERKLGINKLTVHHFDNFKLLGISDSIYFKSALILKLKTLRLIDRAQNSLEKIYAIDPYNIDLLDTYSNILYLQNDKVNLSKLVKTCAKYSRFRPQTCFAIGNLYNLACQHSESAIYFQQSVILNPSYTEAWTLLGHQFIEIRNLPSSLVCYKKAIELDKLEYRAWFGLGQLYELMNMPHQSLSLYKKAYFLRPSDSKISRAVARLLESFGKINECINMLTVSIDNGDQEGGSTFKLASLLETRDRDKAAALYKRFLTLYSDKGMASADDNSTATIFLMDYYFEKQQFNEAELYARRGSRFNQSLKHSQMILNKINDAMANTPHKTKSHAKIPARPSLFTDAQKSDDSDMDMGVSP